MTSSFTLFVEGKPIPQGSKNVGKHGQVYEQNSLALHAWRDAITMHARQQMRGAEPIEGGIELYLDFFFRRGRHHYNKGGLKASAPGDHLFKPDLDKLSRAVLDALSGVVFHDDRQVVGLTARKQWAGRDEPDGVGILAAVLLEKDLDRQLV